MPKDNAPTQRMKLTIKGLVQGVCFRMTTQQEVIKNYPNITGYVKNLANGDVELLAEGAQLDLDKIKSFCYQGVSASRVDEIMEDRETISSGTFTDFSIQYG